MPRLIRRAVLVRRDDEASGADAVAANARDRHRRAVRGIRPRGAGVATTERRGGDEDARDRVLHLAKAIMASNRWTRRRRGHRTGESRWLARTRRRRRSGAIAREPLC